MSASSDFINKFRRKSLDRFEDRHRIRSISGFIEDFLVNPYSYLRNSPRYLCDMFEHYGTDDVQRIGMTDRRWKLFDQDFGRQENSLVAQERVQNSIYLKLRQFARNGIADRLILLHGPNGSAKSTTIQSIMHAMTHYSTLPEGSMYRFNWIFPLKSDDVGRIGFEESEQDEMGTYAFLKPKEIGSVIRCELKDSPLFLIPRQERKELIDEALIAHPEIADMEHFSYEWAIHGDLSQKSKWIYEALLAANQGDWTEVMRYIQVERFFHSKRYRLGCISIEPQANIDAQTRMMAYEGTGLPGVLHGIPLFELDGELVDANRGLCEYSDFLKRPPETNKYLLTTSEKGTIQLPNYRAHLDIVLTGTANEKQLNLFKRTPDFSSFKGRLSFVRVPYLLQYSREAELYRRNLKVHSTTRSVAPHTAEMTALWAVLTRLKRPSPKNHRPDLAPIVSKLTPIQKALLYDHGAMPDDLKNDEKMLLNRSIRQLREEHDEVEGEFEGIYGSEYEGRRGASPREMITLIALAAEDKSWSTLSPLSIFTELEKFVKESSVHDFLRLPVDNGYNEYMKFIDVVRQHYLELVRSEVFDSIGLVEEHEFDRVFTDYFQQLKALDPSASLYPGTRDTSLSSANSISRVEELLNVQVAAEFRSNVLSKLGAYATENPESVIHYHELFPDLLRKLKQSIWAEKSDQLELALVNVQKYFSEEHGSLSVDDITMVENTLTKLRESYGYDHQSAQDIIGFIVSSQRFQENSE
ncbi:MAG TPA: hypothetical protein EYQ08_11830 [Planctomycetes bacterium]|nr:hypothetical protein [Planctomycetota bacterium]